MFQMLDDVDTPMGNKVVLIGGDMRQILPVFKGLSVEQVVDKTLPKWNLWGEFEHLELKQNMRAIADPEYADWVLKVGDGTANENGSDNLKIPDEIVLHNTSRDQGVIADALVEKVLFSPSISVSVLSRI